MQELGSQDLNIDAIKAKIAENLEEQRILTE